MHGPLREARERAGLSQREVARRLGFHPTIYGKVERGERLLDVIEFVRLAGAVGVSPVELLGHYLVAVQHERLSQTGKGAEYMGSGPA